MTRFVHPLPYGAQMDADGRTRFRLWAPGATEVMLEIDQRPPLRLQRSEDGLFEGEAECGEGTHYRYRVSSVLAVPDPAARLQGGDVHDASVVVDPSAYEWRSTSWRGRPWREIVIYELHVGCCGGFAGVEQKLPMLAQLGVTAVQLMPIAAFSGRRNWGYDGVLPYAPDAAYGSPDELKRLIDRAHELGLCVYLDVVYNHFGPDGNFLHAFAPQFFDENNHSPWGAAIDFTRPQVREFFAQNALYWLLEYRFDGLRFDAVHAISDPGWLDEMAAMVRAAIEPERQVQLMLENEHNEASHLRGEFDAQWNDDAHNAIHVLLTGEREGYYANYSDAPAALLARCLGEGFAYQGEPSPGHGGAPRGTPSADLAPPAFIFFLQNHDQIGNRALGERLTVLAEPQALRAAIVLQLLCPQIPLLFMGEEWGCRTPFLFFTDFHAELADAVREGRRREFAHFTAFADAEARAKIPDPNAESTFLASIPVCEGGHDNNAHWDWYAELLALRRRHIVPRLAGCASIGAQACGDAAVIAAWRCGDGAILRIAVNFAAADCAIPAQTGALLCESAVGAGESAMRGVVAARSASVFLEPALAETVLTDTTAAGTAR